jgi:hypothetical protein
MIDQSSYDDIASNLIMNKFSRWNLVACLIFVILNLVVFYSREPVRNLAYSEAKDQMLTVDISSWAIYGFVEPICNIAYLRMAREGWVDNESWVKYVNKTVADFAYERLLISASFAYLPEKTLLKNITAINLNFLYPMENWVNDYVDIDIVEDRQF